MAYRSASAYRQAETFAPGAEGIEYQNAFEYRAGDVPHTGALGYRYLRRRYGIFPQAYRNSWDYRSDGLRYRLGVDDPLLESATGTDAESLSAVLTPTDTASGAEGAVAGISVTLEGGGPVLESVTGILEASTLSVSSTDTGSGAETEISGIAATDSDTGTGTEGPALFYLAGTETGAGVDTQALTVALYDPQGRLLYRTSNNYQTDLEYRSTGVTESFAATETHSISVSSSDEANVHDGSLDYQNNAQYQSPRLYRTLGEDAAIGIGATDDDIMTFLEAVGDRTLSVDELMDLAEDAFGPIGTVAGPLSLRVDLHYRTNRAGRFPGRMRSRR